MFNMAAVLGQPFFLGALYAKSILKIHYGSVYMMAPSNFWNQFGFWWNSVWDTVPELHDSILIWTYQLELLLCMKVWISF